MAIIWLQSSIWSNRFKTAVLILLFPALIFWVVFWVVFWLKLYQWYKIPDPNTSIWWEYKSYINYIELIKKKKNYENLINLIEKNLDNNPELSYLKDSVSTFNQYNYNQKLLEEVNLQLGTFSNTKYSPEVKEIYSYINSDNPIRKSIDYTIYIFGFLGPIILVWALISFLFHRQIIFTFTGAMPITRKEYPEIYNIVENLCISRGLPVPNIWILEDDSLNAFAVGRNVKKSWIVFSRWIINKLNKQELEAVAAHELTHIINKDWLLMVTIIVFIWAIAAIWEILVRSVSKSSSNRNSKWDWKAIILIIWLALLFLWYIVLPLVQLAVSRKREYLADAWSVAITHDKLSMISALQKISQDSVIESIKKDSISALCINNPFPKAKWITNWFHEFFSTHPTIENRVEILNKY